MNKVLSERVEILNNMAAEIGLDYYPIQSLHIEPLPKHRRPTDREAVVALKPSSDALIVFPDFGVNARQQLRFLLFESRGAARVLSFVPLGVRHDNT